MRKTPETAARPGHLHWLLGPVGAGKSTLALELARTHRGVRLNLDEWMATLFRPDRPDHGVLHWYRERVDRCLEQIWSLALELAHAGTNVILEIGLVQRGARVLFFERIDASGLDLTIHVVDAPREVRRERVMRRNEEQGSTFAMVVPLEFFEIASDMWEPLDEHEIEGRSVHYVTT